MREAIGCWLCCTAVRVTTCPSLGYARCTWRAPTQTSPVIRTLLLAAHLAAARTLMTTATSARKKETNVLRLRVRVLSPRLSVSHMWMKWRILMYLDLYLPIQITQMHCQKYLKFCDFRSLEKSWHKWIWNKFHNLLKIMFPIQPISSHWCNT